MTQLNIGTVVGSIRKASINARIADALERLAPPSVAFHRIRIDDLPLYNQDLDNPPVAEVHRLRQEVRSADGIIFVTPEYNRSIPGVLKNAIDHASRPHREGAWVGKPAGVIGATPGALGTAPAQQHLRNVLACLGMPTLAQPDAFIHVDEGFFSAEGLVARGADRDFLTRWMAHYVEWVRKHAPAR